MSTSVDQRTKGQSNQVSNGPGKEHLKEEFDAYLTQPPQGAYGTAMSSPNVSEPPYMPNYYPSMSFPYLGQGGVSDGHGSWSNADPMSFLGGYGQINSEYGGMFSGFGYQPGFGWEFSGGDYNAWGPSSTAGRKEEGRPYAADAYYGIAPPDYGHMNGEVERDMKAVEQGFKGVSINDHHKGEMVRENHHHHHHHQGMGDGPSASGSAGPAPSSAPPKKTWASIASQPARPQVKLQAKTIPRAPMVPKHNMDIGTWDNRGGAVKGGAPQQRQAWSGGSARGNRSGGPPSYPVGTSGPSSSSPSSNNVSNNSAPVANTPAHPVLERLKSANQYNPKDFNLNPKGARFFIIKSYSEDDIHRSIKYSIWCSTEHGNKRLDTAYREREGKGPVYLLFSVNGSGHFCGMAQMMSPLDYSATSSVWAQDKWKGQMEVKWIYVKDVPNSQLRHIRLENNENKPVTNSRDTQEVPPEKGKQVLKIIHNYRHTTSIFDDFVHYEKRQEEEAAKIQAMTQDGSGDNGPPPRDSGKNGRENGRDTRERRGGNRSSNQSN